MKIKRVSGDVIMEMETLRGADLCNAKLCSADLREANLCGADLCGADLRGADLCGANLRCASLRDANLRCADLREASLCGADLCGANLYGANLCGADLCGANLTNTVANLQCPETGEFIGYKKLKDDKIAQIKITEDALRSSATSRKCRCSKAKVISITRGDESFGDGVSKYDNQFVYRVGETVSVDDFDTNRWNECGSGIHFFITKQEAIDF